MKRVYVDNNATTMVAPEVVEAMIPFFGKMYGNPSSAHALGGQAAAAVIRAREQVADLLGADCSEIVFTSCGTESDNHAILGSFRARPEKKHIITTTVEHPAVLNMCEFLSRKGFRVTEIPVNDKGLINPRDVEEALCDDTAIVSIMYANNETGVILPVEEIAEIVKAHGAIFHTDAVQAVGKIPIDMSRNAIDLLSISGHKLHAPKGIGVLYVRKGTRISPFMLGGNQEKGKRGGTENVPYIIGLGVACELAKKQIDGESSRVRELRDRLENGLLGNVENATVNGDREKRLPNTCNMSFAGAEGEAIVLALDMQGIAVSSGSACTSGATEASHVLQAMGLPSEILKGAVRFSLSRYNTEEEIDHVIEKLTPIIKRIRNLSPSRTKN